MGAVFNNTSKNCVSKCEDYEPFWQKKHAQVE